jgi:hypothetical protein
VIESDPPPPLFGFNAVRAVMANPSQSGPVVSMSVVGVGLLALGIVARSLVLIGIGGLVLVLAVFWLGQAMRAHHAIHRLARHALEEQAAELRKPGV